MKILVINTALQLSFIALKKDKDNFIKTFSFQNTSENLLPEIDKLLKKQKVKLKDLDAVSVCVGPGSFTGIRVGVATAKALGIALSIPLISFTAFDLFPKQKICLTKANSGGAYAFCDGEISFLDKEETEKLTKKNVQIFEEEKSYFQNFSKVVTYNLVEESINTTLKFFKGKKFYAVKELIPLYVQKSQAENELSLNVRNAKISSVKKEDIKRLEEIEKECFSKPYSADILNKELGNESKKMFCILLKNQVIGYVLYNQVLSEIELERVCIIKKYQGLGLAEKLIKETFNLLQAKKCFLEVNKNNKIAIKLYEKLGFTKTGERKNYYGEGEDAVLMTKVF